jgi:hypothetical protein
MGASAHKRDPDTCSSSQPDELSERTRMATDRTALITTSVTAAGIDRTGRSAGRVMDDPTQKAPATNSGARSGLLHLLITDEPTAAAALDLIGSGHDAGLDGPARRDSR